MRFNVKEPLLEKKIDKSKRTPTIGEILKDLRGHEKLNSSEKFYIECMFDPAIKRSTGLKLEDIQWVKELWLSVCN